MSYLEIKNIRKSYDDTLALDNVSFQVEQGRIFALLGPNGAGKSTLVKALLGLVHLDTGEITIEQRPTHGVDVRQNLAYLPEKFSFYQFETVYGTLRFYQNLRGSDDPSEIQNAMNKLSITELKHKKMGKLSKGQKQRVGLASLLMGSRNFLILDEPFSGLDPIGIKDLKDLIKELKQQDKTILINSHILTEMDLMADDIGILNKGKLLTSGKKADILAGKSLEDYFYQLIKGAAQ